MRLMLILLLIAAPTLAAVPTDPVRLPSSISGVYLGNTRVCRIVLSRYQEHWVQFDVRCQEFSGNQTASLTTLYSPGVCPTPIALSLTPQFPREYLGIWGFDAVDETLTVVVGTDQLGVGQGLGTAEAWYRIGYAPSPSPYECATASVPLVDPLALARWCRQHPNVPACK